MAGSGPGSTPRDGTPDLLVTNGRVVTMNPDREILDRGAVAIRGEEVLEVGPSDALRTRWPAAPAIDARGGLVTPGFVNAHQHVTGGPLTWSVIPDNLPSGESIFSWAVPIHAAERPEDEELSASIAAAASLRNGVTTLIEPGTTGDAAPVARGLLAAGIRASVGVWAWDIEQGPFAAPAAEILERIRAVLGAFPVGGRVEGWVTLIGHSLASDELLTGAADLARSAGVGMTMHLSPTSSDPEVYLERHGRRPVIHLEALGVLGPQLLLGHAVWLDDAELDAVVASRTAVAYCPWAYLRLGQGVTGQGRHAELYRRGGRVALGCDSVTAGDSLDVLRTAALAAGIAKDQRVDPTWFGAHEALEMATIAGAEALGMADRIGSLEPGKLADVVVFEADRPQWAVDADPALQLVWGTDGRSVRDVLVGGRPVVRDGRCVTLDEDELRERARVASAALLGRAGLVAPTRWPLRRHP